MHKKRWLEHCEKNPDLGDNRLDSKQEVLLSLIGELEFNKIIAETLVNYLYLSRPNKFT